MVDTLKLRAGQLLERANALVETHNGDRPLALESKGDSLLSIRGRFAYRFARLLHPKELAIQQRELAQVCLHSVLKESIDRLSTNAGSGAMSEATRASIDSLFGEVEQRLTSELTGECALTAKKMVSILSFASDRIAQLEEHNLKAEELALPDDYPLYKPIEMVKAKLLLKLHEPIEFSLTGIDNATGMAINTKAQALDFLHDQIDKAFCGELEWRQDVFDRYNQLRGEIEALSLELSLLVDKAVESLDDSNQSPELSAKLEQWLKSGIHDMEVQVSDWIYTFRTSASPEAKSLYLAASQVRHLLGEVTVLGGDSNADPSKRREAIAIQSRLESIYQSLVNQRYAPLHHQLANPALAQWHGLLKELRQIAPSIASKAMMHQLDSVEIREIEGPGGPSGHRELLRNMKPYRQGAAVGSEHAAGAQSLIDSGSKAASSRSVGFKDQSERLSSSSEESPAFRVRPTGASVRRLQEARLSLPQNDHVHVLEQWTKDQESYEQAGEVAGLGDRLWNSWDRLPHPVTQATGRKSYVNLVLADFYNHRDLGSSQHEVARKQMLNRRRLRSDEVDWMAPIRPPMSLMRSASRRDLSGSSREHSSGSELERLSELEANATNGVDPTLPKQIPSVQAQARLSKHARVFLQGDFMATAKPATTLRGLQIQVGVIAKFLAKGGEHNEALRANAEDLRVKLTERLKKLSLAVDARIRHKTDKREEERRKEYETLAASIVNLCAQIRSFDPETEI